MVFMSQPVTFSRSEKMLLAVLAAVQFNHIVDFMLLMPLGPKLMRIFDISTQQFSLLVSSYTIFAGLSGFTSSFFMDVFDRKKLLALFFFGFCVGTFACGFSPSYEILLISRSVTGMFGGVLNSLVMSIVSDAIPYTKRGTAMGVITTAFSLASVLGVPLGLYLTDVWDWHAGFIFLGILSVIVFGLIFKGVPAQQQFVSRTSKRDVLEPLRQLAQSRPQQWALVFAGCLVLGQFMIIPFLSPSLVANAGMKESQLPLIYFVGGVLTFFSGPLVGRLADQFGKHKIFLYGLLSSLVPTLVITHMFPVPVFAILTVTGLFFICVNARWVPALALISGAAPPKYRGSFMSFVGCIQQLMAAIGSLIAGLIVSKDSVGHILNYQYIGYISVSVSLLALLLSRRVTVLDQNPVAIEPAPEVIVAPAPPKH